MTGAAWTWYRSFDVVGVVPASKPMIGVTSFSDPPVIGEADPAILMAANRTYQII
jgi:hypothetical protein